mmetsp:Transcript_29045/g.93663  ORF Transcript_29045/g.93663 Transcript_29045/m.93663 type:complete len:99 (-) Transcript_29045:448-744(-)
MMGVRSLLIVLVSSAAMVDAFSPTACDRRGLQVAAGPTTVRKTTMTTTPLAATKNAKEGSPKKLDSGEIALMFVNPLNPYSWFLYMLAGITLYGNLAQ